MNKVLKWGLLAVGALVVLVAGSIIVVPMVVDVKQYKPQIESLVAQKTGRSFALGDDIQLSLFPWVGVKLSEVTLGSGKGFAAGDMVAVKSFEVRLKVMPLFSRQVEVESFLLDSPRIALERNKAGRANWENIGPVASQDKSAGGNSQAAAQIDSAAPVVSAGQAANKAESAEANKTVRSAESIEGVAPKGKTASAEVQGLPITSLEVGRVAIINGNLSYTDETTGTSKTLSDLNLELTDISLERPLTLSLQALVDNQPIALQGSVGPLGRNPGKENMGLDLNLSALDLLKINMKGTLLLAGQTPAVDVAVELAPFSIRQLFERLGQTFPVETSDPEVLKKVAFSAGVKGSSAAVELQNGKLLLDDSTLAFSATAKAFDKPDVRFELNLDKIDADRYLPPKKERGAEPAGSPAVSQGAAQDSSQAPAATGGNEAKDAAVVSGGQVARSAGSVQSAPPAKDYSGLRRLVLDGHLKIGELKVANLTMSEVTAKLTAKNGIINLAPLAMQLYDGNASVSAQVDVRGKTPKSVVGVKASGVQAGPLVRDGAGKDVIEGTLAVDMNVNVTGDSPEQIRQSLGGKGALTFTDGAIVGIDIAGTLRNAGAGLGLTEKVSDKPKTDFAELSIPYEANKGLVAIPGASLVSPLLRFGLSGKTDLVKEDLDFRLEPKLVATLKGQGDTEARSGLLVPLLVGGTWSKPEIRPDLESMVKQQLANPEGVKNLIKGGVSGEEVKEKAKSLLQGLFQ